MSKRTDKKNKSLKQCIPNDDLRPTTVDREDLLGGPF